METFVRRYGIFLKHHLTTVSYWGQMVMFILLTLVVLGIHAPTVENNLVGLYARGDVDARIVEYLKKSGDELEFIRFSEEKELYDAVISAKIDSGFILPEDPVAEKIVAVSSPMTTKGALAQETLSAACYPLFSERKLMQADERIFGQGDEARQQYLLDRNKAYLDGGNLFDIRVERVFNTPGKAAKESRAPLYIVWLFLSGIVLILQLGFLRNRRNAGALRLALPFREYVAWSLAYGLAGWTMPVLLSLVLYMVAGML